MCPEKSFKLQLLRWIILHVHCMQWDKVINLWCLNSKDRLGSSEQYDVSLKSCLHSKYTKKEILLLPAKQQSLENVVPFLFRLTNIIFCLSSKSEHYFFFTLNNLASVYRAEWEKSCMFIAKLSKSWSTMHLRKKTLLSCM